MDYEDKRIIEINGVKLEVDLRTAKRVDELKVGDRVKVLSKEYSDYKVHHGIIVGFEPFAKLPTIIVCYLDIDYSSCNLKFLYFNSQSENVEIVPSLDDDKIAIEKDTITERFGREIAKKEEELEQIKNKKSFFEKNFHKYWDFQQTEAEEIYGKAGS